MVAANQVHAQRCGHDGVPRVLFFEPAAPVLSLGRRLHGLVAEAPSPPCATTYPRASAAPAWSAAAGAAEAPDDHRNRDRDSLAEAIARGLQVRLDDRGGGATLHQPGQLVAFVAWPMSREAVPAFVDATLRNLALALHDLGAMDVTAKVEGGDTGLWRGERKLLSAGLRHVGGVVRHGFALQICGDLGHGRGLLLCGRRSQGFADLADTVLSFAPKPVLAATTVFAAALATASLNTRAGA